MHITLAKFGVDINEDGLLQAEELNDLGRKAMARGFSQLDKGLGVQVITPELATRAAKEVDGKFTAFAAFKESLRGFKDAFYTPFKEHPIRSTLVTGGLVALILVFPSVAPYRAAGLPDPAPGEPVAERAWRKRATPTRFVQRISSFWTPVQSRRLVRLTPEPFPGAAGRWQPAKYRLIHANGSWLH